jgi:hypothetical protein
MAFDEQRFWSKVDIIRDEDSCWIWKGKCSRNGYGRFHQTVSVGVYKQFGAHRVSYEISNGEIPDNHVVCHKCDNPQCVRPEHLFVGTQSDNLIDMHNKKRWNHKDRSGENNNSAKLTAREVSEIRNKYKPRIYTGRMLAEEYGVSIPLVEKILARKIWKDVE